MEALALLEPGNFMSYYARSIVALALALSLAACAAPPPPQAAPTPPPAKRLDAKSQLEMNR